MENASGEMPGAFHICAADDGEGLAVDGEGAKAEDERGEGQVRRSSGKTAHGGHAAAKLQESAKEALAEMQLKAKVGGELAG